MIEREAIAGAPMPLIADPLRKFVETDNDGD
jgi:hypothetical protein